MAKKRSRRVVRRARKTVRKVRRTARVKARKVVRKAKTKRVAKRVVKRAVRTVKKRAPGFMKGSKTLKQREKEFMAFAKRKERMLERQIARAGTFHDKMIPVISKANKVGKALGIPNYITGPIDGLLSMERPKYDQKLISHLISGAKAVNDMPLKGKSAKVRAAVMSTSSKSQKVMDALRKPEDKMAHRLHMG